jgi:hypothetical protein
MTLLHLGIALFVLGYLLGILLIVRAFKNHLRNQDLNKPTEPPAPTDPLRRPLFVEPDMRHQCAVMKQQEERKRTERKLRILAGLDLLLWIAGLVLIIFG